MTDFFQALADHTAAEREYLLGSPIIHDALEGRVTLAQYLAFLTEAYHHVKCTVPLLMACGSRLGDDYEWLRGAIVHYINDEYGHQEWILNDIAAAGGDPEAVRHGTPGFATEQMVSYAWDTIGRGNPVGFFGMVYVLEGTSIAIAGQAAGSIGRSLGLPESAFSYLISHGEVDQEHVKFLAGLLNRLEREEDRQAVRHCARRFFLLYAGIFRSLPAAGSATERAVA
jgi:pyrroloquinoline quinone (PQQ) biosynthesis protein C